MAQVVGQVNVLELAAGEDGGGLEAGGRALDEGGRHCVGREGVRETS